MLMMRKAIKQILKVRLMELAATCCADRVRTIIGNTARFARDKDS